MAVQSRVSKLQEQQEIMRLDEHKFRDYLSEVESVSRKHQQMLQDTDEQITLLGKSHTSSKICFSRSLTHPPLPQVFTSY